eukprot:GHRQ01027969.1.p1 GENE.GHRQ01027969.1~~GHRQ01027969.1.p1  ORF type:complete len:139 (-),score=45.05 GHRQ01027969.1:389-805(-)
MPALGQMENATLMEVEHTPPVHKRMLDILPGVSGGVARIMVGQPFDTIKTRLQVLGKGTIGAAGMPADMVYTSGMDCVRKMVSLMVVVVAMLCQRHALGQCLVSATVQQLLQPLTCLQLLLILPRLHFMRYLRCCCVH